MATHTGPNHENNRKIGVDIHDTGLVDECPRCEEHAEHPFSSLDESMLLALLERIDNSDHSRSTNEGIAMAKIRASIFIAQKLYTLRPDLITVGMM